MKGREAGWWSSQLIGLIVRKIHLYTALTVGVLLSIIGISGSWLEFYPALDSSLLHFPTESSGPAHWDRVLDAANRTAGVPVRMSMLLLPWGGRGTALVLMQKGSEMASLDFCQAYVDPGSGRVLMARDLISRHQDWRTNLSGVMFAIHTGLFAGSTGLAVVGVLGVFLLISVITGLYWWWPRGRWRRAHFVIASRVGSRAFLPDLHRVSSLYASLLLGVAAVTGFHWAFRPVTSRVVASLLPMAEESSAAMDHSAMAMDGPEKPSTGLGFDAAVTRAQALFPGRPLKTAMVMGVAPHLMYEVGLAPFDGTARGAGATEVLLDSAGRVFSIKDPARDRAGDVLLRWLTPLHMGDPFGVAGHAIMAILGLIPAASLFTGVWIWLRRKRILRPGPA